MYVEEKLKNDVMSELVGNNHVLGLTVSSVS